MRVLFDARTSSWTGVGRYVTGLLSRLMDLSPIDLVVLTSEDFSYYQKIEKIYMRFNVLSTRGLFELTFASRRKGIDIIHSPMYVTPLLPSSRLVVTIHDLIPIRMPEVMTGKSRRSMYYLLNKLAVNNADAILVPSSSTKYDVIDIFRCSEGKVHVIPHALDDVFFNIRSRSSHTCKGLHPEERYLLGIGNHKPHKNLVKLLKAFAITRKDVESKLVLIGTEDSLSSEIRAIIDKLGIKKEVFFSGKLTDAELINLYSGALAFIFPSVYEGFGLPPLEAMACGVPVACSNSASLPEVVGDSALLFDPYTVDSIADAIIKITFDQKLRSSLTEKGRRRVRNFSWDSTATNILEVYNKIIR